MNLSRAYSLDYDDDLSVGRVQTPTLAMLVARELEIRAFVPEDYLEVVAKFDAGDGKVYEGNLVRAEKEGKRESRLPPDRRARQGNRQARQGWRGGDPERRAEEEDDRSAGVL